MKKISAGEDISKTLATAGLILTNTMIFEEILARLNPELKTLAQIRSERNVKKVLEDEWSKILQINYDPIFLMALNILRNLPTSPSLDRKLRDLIDAAYDIAASRVLLRHDLAGRIYHELLLGDLIKYYATLYTSIPAARLLARLVVNLPSPLDCNGVPPKYGDEPLKVVDFACGSGTLLSSMYKEIDAKHRVNSESPDAESLHRYLIEEGLWGFDVLLHATHLTALTLFLHNPHAPVSKSRIYKLPLGVSGTKKNLGSVDFLRTSEIPSLGISFTGEVVGTQRISVSKREIGEIRIPSEFHICIMNPPFTRSVGGNLLFGSLPPKERAKLQEELGELLKEKELTGIGQAGLGAIFVCLADNYIKEGGRIAFVLPKSVLAGVAWRKIREILLNKYHIEFIISSFEGPDSWNFSENTSLSEILLVARKLRKAEENGYTIFVNLWSKPKSEVESIFIGSSLLELYKAAKLYDLRNANASFYHLRSRGKKIGEAYSAKIDELDFGYLQLFAQADLNRAIALLRQGTVYTPTDGIAGRIPLTSITNFVREIGPDVRQVHSAFKKGNSYHPEHVYCALWDHDSNLIRTISQEPNVCLDPKDGKLARQLWQKGGKLLVAERARLSTCRVYALVVSREVLSNVWWPMKTNEVQTKDRKLTPEEVSEILTLWLNSTYGTLLLLSIAEVTEGAWVKFKKEPLSNLLVIDLSKLNNDQIEKLLRLYEDVRLRELKPLPDEYAEPEVRCRIDETFNEILGLNVDLKNSLYKLLASDPTITAESLK
jgi:type I restriction-modification system DNA methylase subunit